MKRILMIAAAGAALAAGFAQAGDGHRKHDSFAGPCEAEHSAAAEWLMNAKQAKRHVLAHLPGKVIDVRADTSDRGVPHYHVDVRLPQGALARLNVDAASGEFSWREPAVLQD